MKRLCDCIKHQTESVIQEASILHGFTFYNNQLTRPKKKSSASPKHSRFYTNNQRKMATQSIR